MIKDEIIVWHRSDVEFRLDESAGKVYLAYEAEQNGETIFFWINIDPDNTKVLAAHAKFIFDERKKQRERVKQAVDGKRPARTK